MTGDRQVGLDDEQVKDQKEGGRRNYKQKAINNEEHRGHFLLVKGEVRFFRRFTSAVVAYRAQIDPGGGETIDPSAHLSDY